MLAQALVAAQRGGIEGSSKFFQSMFIQGYYGHCVFLLAVVRGKVHGNGLEGIKFVNWWLIRNVNFSSGYQGNIIFYNGTQRICPRYTRVSCGTIYVKSYVLNVSTIREVSLELATSSNHCGWPHLRFRIWQ
jgi:hypothetical protein